MWERAIYGLLSGDVDTARAPATLTSSSSASASSIQPSASSLSAASGAWLWSWEDELWARLSAHVTRTVARTALDFHAQREQGTRRAIAAGSVSGSGSTIDNLIDHASASVSANGSGFGASASTLLLSNGSDPARDACIRDLTSSSSSASATTIAALIPPVGGSMSTGATSTATATGTSDGSACAYRTVQSLLIADRREHALAALADAADGRSGTAAQTQTFEFLRFAVHLALHLGELLAVDSSSALSSSSPASSVLASPLSPSSPSSSASSSSSASARAPHHPLVDRCVAAFVRHCIARQQFEFVAPYVMLLPKHETRVTMLKGIGCRSYTLALLLWLLWVALSHQSR